MPDFMQKITEENEDLFCHAVYEWIGHGWELEMEPTPEQIAAALFMEANTQDRYVKEGDSDASHPIRLRALAYRILEHFHPRPDSHVP
jgi:hypothetical protein